MSHNFNRRAPGWMPAFVRSRRDEAEGDSRTTRVPLPLRRPFAPVAPLARPEDVDDFDIDDPPPSYDEVVFFVLTI